MMRIKMYVYDWYTECVKSVRILNYNSISEKILNFGKIRGIV